MKEEQSNIDRHIREKLENYPVEPPAHIWDNVQAEVKALRRKKMIAFYSRVAAAAVIVIAFLAGWYFNERTDSPQPEIVQNEPVAEPPTQEDLASVESRDYSSDSTASDSPEQRETLLAAQREEEEPIEERAEVQKPIDREIIENGVPTDEFLIRDEEPDLRPIEYLAARLNFKSDAPNADRMVTPDDNDLQITEEERTIIAMNADALGTNSEKNASWTMGVSISPGYSYHESSHSSVYAQNMPAQSAEANLNIGGGIAVQYKTGKRWSIESGLYYAKNGQKSANADGRPTFANSDVEYSMPLSLVQNRINVAVQVEGDRIAMNSVAGVIEFDEVPDGALLSANPEADAISSNSLLANGTFNQVFDFVEIPLYMRYLILDSKVDVEVLGGINAALTVGNTVFFQNETGTRDVGETKDISPLNMSGTLGVGVNYALGSKLSVAVEPRFNYYLNSISSNPNVEYKPYRIGIYTGLYYDF